MAIKTIQLLRSNTVYTSHKAALDALVEQLTSVNAKDGQPILARYKVGETGTEHTLLGIKGKTGYEIFDNEGTQSAAVTSVQYDKNTKKITYTKNGSPTDVVTLAAVATTGAAADVTFGATDVAAELTSINGKIAAMDKNASAVDGQVVTTVSEANGVVSETKANVKDLQLGGYEKNTAATGAIGGTDTINTALSKLENTVATNAIVSDDGSIKVGPSATAGTSVVVNVDGTTIVKSTGGALKADLTVAKLTDDEVTALSDANVKEAYKLIYKTDAGRTAIGDVVKIYKDSALQEVYLGSGKDTINPTTGVITKDPVTDPQSMNFAYQLANGTYSLTKIDVSKFLTDSEFADGLQVSDAGVVSVKKDANSGKVRIAAAPAEGEDTGLVDVLTVSTDGVKVDNIQNAINYAVNTATDNLDYTDKFESHKFVTEVDEVNGVISVQRAQPTAGDIATTAVDADSTHVAIAGTDAATQIDNISVAIKAEETARTNAIAALDAEITSADGKNVQVKVTEVDGAITAVNITTDNTVNSTDVSNAITNAIADLDVTDTAVANQFVTSVSETDGKISVQRAQPAAAGVTVADAGGYFDATDVEAALAELATFNCGEY